MKNPRSSSIPCDEVSSPVCKLKNLGFVTWLELLQDDREHGTFRRGLLRAYIEVLLKGWGPGAKLLHSATPEPNPNVNRYV